MPLRRWLRRPDLVHDVWIEERKCRVSVKRNQTLLQAALEANVDFPHLCRVGSCGTCKCRLVSGRVKMLTDTSYVLSAQDVRDGYILACQALVRSEARVSLGATATVAVPAARRVPGTISALKPLTSRLFEMRVALEAPLPHRAGQYAEIHHPCVEEGRSYSFVESSLSADPCEAAFHISPVPGGRFSTWLLSSDRRGEGVTVAGPYGAFGWPGENPGPVLCVAGGSGMGVMQTILGEALRQGKCEPLVFLYGARTQADLFWLDKVDEIRTQWSAPFEFAPVLSQEPAPSDWVGARGRVADFVDPAGFTKPISSWRVLLCGPPRMVDTAVSKLRAIGFLPRQISFDKFEPRYTDRSDVAHEPFVEEL